MISKKVMVFLSGQAVFQLAMLVSGLIIVRHLGVGDYALYTLANMLIGFGTVASDLGLSNALVTFGTKLLKRGDTLGGLYAAALRMRRTLFLATITVMCVLTYFLYRPEWTLEAYLIVLTLVVASNYVQITIQLRKSIHNIHQDASTLSTATSASSLVRVVLITIVCALGAGVIVVIAVNLIAYLLEQYILGKLGHWPVSAEKSGIRSAKTSLYKFILPTIPNRIYFMLQSQIGLLLLSVMGITREMAELGALGRLNMVLTFITILNPFLIQPRLAAIDERQLYLRTFATIVFVVSCMMAVAVITSAWLPSIWLLLIGPKYYHLSAEVHLTVLGGAVFVLGAVVSTATMALGNMSRQYFVAIAGLGAQVIYFLTLSGPFHLYNALMINIAINTAVLAAHSLLWFRAYKLHAW